MGAYSKGCVPEISFPGEEFCGTVDGLLAQTPEARRGKVTSFKQTRLPSKADRLQPLQSKQTWTKMLKRARVANPFERLCETDRDLAACERFKLKCYQLKSTPDLEI